MEALICAMEDLISAIGPNLLYFGWEKWMATSAFFLGRKKTVFEGKMRLKNNLIYLEKMENSYN
jgi:hypothetical protein